MLLIPAYSEENRPPITWPARSCLYYNYTSDKIIPVQPRQYLNHLELFWKIFSAKWVQNNPATETMALYSHKCEESEG